MYQNREFLGTEPVGRLLRRLAIPTVTAQLINMLYNLVDRVYIGHIPENGSAALTGLGVCAPMILLVSAFAGFAAFGGAPRSSIAMGRRDYEDAEEILGNCFALQLTISIVLTATLLLFNRPLLLLFGASENTIPYALSYMNIYSVGTIFVQMTLGMNAFITAQGFTKISMASVMIGAIINIILDPICIFLLDMGVAGAALATILAQGCSCVWVLSFLCGKKGVLRLRKKHIRLKKKVIAPCIALGAANFIMNGSEGLLFVCYNSSLLKYGGDIAVGAMTMISSVTQLITLPMQGVGQGAQPIISFNYGAGKPDRVRKAVRLLLTVNIAFGCFMWILVQFTPQLFTGLFTSNAELAAYGQKAMRLYYGTMFLWGIQLACQSAFGALGNAKASIMVASVRKFVLLIPLIYILPPLMPGYETSAVYVTEAIADVFAMSFTAVLFYFQFKKAMKPLEQASEAKDR